MIQLENKMTKIHKTHFEDECSRFYYLILTHENCKIEKHI
jgi:hypothetical protein